MQDKWNYSLFSCFGVELEYMIVDASTLQVAPISDRALASFSGEIVEEVEVGDYAWSNELALHVIELKAAHPTITLAGWEKGVQKQIQDMNRRLEPFGARLMPTAAHPWMNPHQETRLWPHQYNPVYEAYNRIFSCQGHGWSNLQSVHLNLPFANAQEFGRLHAAIRLILPLLPGLAASSPILDKEAGPLDQRLEVYRFNAQKIPSITGRVIPEAIFTPPEYQHGLLVPMYRDIAPHDPEGILQHEWLNSRGAIARFDRGAIEIRVLDIQECPQMDIALLALIVEVLKKMVAEEWIDFKSQKAWEVAPLAEIFEKTIVSAEKTLISNKNYLAVWGIKSHHPHTVQDIWCHLLESVNWTTDAELRWKERIGSLLRHGCLARRILKAMDGDWSHEHMHQVYQEICDCLSMGKLFIP